VSAPYTVKYGDTLSSIANQHGFSSWRELYYHPDNAAFRAKRPNPDKIYVGDVIMIPAAPHQVPPVVPPPIVPPQPPQPAESLSTRFLLVQSGEADQFMSEDRDFFFRILDGLNPHVPRVYWLGPAGGYKHVTKKAEFHRENYRQRSEFHLAPPGRSIADLECDAFYVTNYTAGRPGVQSQLYLGIKPHPVTVKVQRPYKEGTIRRDSSHQRPGRFQLVEHPERYVVDHALPNPFP
jgi:hypothetical protein